MQKLNNYLNKYAIVVVAVFVLDSIFRMTFSAFMLKEEIFLALCSIFSAFYFFSNVYCDLNILKNKRIMFLACFFVLSCVSTMINMTSFISVQNSIYYHIIWFFLIYFFFFNLKTKDNLRKQIKAIFVVFFVALTFFSSVTFLLYVIETILKIDLPFESWTGYVGPMSRLVGISGNPAATGVLAYMLVMVSLYFYIHLKSTVIKIFVGFNLVVATIILVLSDSRGSFLAMFVLFFLSMAYLFQNIKFKNKFIKPVILVFVILSVLFTGYRILGLRRFEEASLSKENVEVLLDKLTSERYSLWKDTAQMIGEKPIMGYGYDHFKENALAIVGEQSTIVRQGLKGPHNVILEVLYATGFLGLVFVTGVFMLIIYDSIINYKCKRNYESVLFISMLCGMFVISLFDFGILFRGTFMSPLFWLVAGFISAENKVIKNDLLAGENSDVR